MRGAVTYFLCSAKKKGVADDTEREREHRAQQSVDDSN